MNYATVCSGIGAPEAAWSDMWGAPEFTAEIEPFPSAVLKHHYPDIPNYGDMTKYKEWPDHEQLRLICGGTPCQSFSVAGLRKGMDDPRGNLTLTYLGLIARYNPRWVIWENVPGVFSSISNAQSDFGCFLSALAELGYSCAYRVLDAQYFGVPQRRRRVFVVGHLGTDWRPPFAVLFEPEGLRGNIKTRREAGEGVAGCFKGKPNLSHREAEDTLITAHGRSEYKDTEEKASSLRACIAKQSDSDLLVMAHGQGNAAYGGNNTSGKIDKATACNAKGGSGRMDFESETFIVNTVHARQDPISSDKALPLESKGGEQAIAIQDGRDISKNQNGLGIDEGGPSYTLDQTDGQAVAFNYDQSEKTRSMGESTEKCPTLRSGGGVAISSNTIVRRLTPMECERLQGFPDGYTLIPWGRAKYQQKASGVYVACPDGPRYKALGNSMAVPVVRWIGRRIQMWEDLNK